MYLSRLLLNQRNKQAMREADDPYQLHRTLARAFGERLEEARVLFRVDRPERSAPRVIVQSLVEPVWSKLPSGYASAEFKRFDLNVDPGTFLRFRLLARPAKRDKETGKRVSVRGDEALRSWLERKADAAGFQIKACAANELRWRDTKGEKQSQALAAVQFDGVLVVTDPDKLREAVRSGIGPQKAYGFGLLSLAPEQVDL